MTTEMLAGAIREKQIAPDAWVAPDPLGDAPDWQKASDVSEIMQALAHLSVKDLRVVAGAFTPTWQGTPEFGASVMIASRPPKR
jgi:hypothetical protein